VGSILRAEAVLHGGSSVAIGVSTPNVFAIVVTDAESAVTSSRYSYL
jgi:hypothetical protein